MSAFLVVFLVLALCDLGAWCKKNVLDYTDADLERLLSEWDKDEEEVPPDELPEHLRPQPSIDLSKLDMSDPEALMAVSKKGKSLMSFVSVSGNPSKQELETITGLWQSSLSNAHIDVQRYVIDDERAIFMFKDGARAWEGKDFLIQQDRCKEVTIEGKSYPGKASTQDSNEKAKIEL